jgi:regulator of replication initiation timing
MVTSGYIRILEESVKRLEERVRVDIQEINSLKQQIQELKLNEIVENNTQQLLKG